MLRLAKYLEPYLLLILIAVALLFVRANAYLALPDYMSNIVNYGIQQGGIQNVVPPATHQSQMNRLVLFMSGAGKSAVLGDYVLVDKNSAQYTQYLKDYPAPANEPIYILKTTSQGKSTSSTRSWARLCDCGLHPASGIRSIQGGHGAGRGA